MAITIQSQPDEDFKQPAWNDLNFVVSSDNTAQPGFKIIANVKVNGTTVQKLNLYVYPNTIRCWCNVSRIVQNYVTDIYQGGLTSPDVDYSQTLTTVQVTFQEWYEVSGTGGLRGTVVSSDVIDVWKSSLSLNEVVENETVKFQLDSAIAADNGTIKLLTPFTNRITGNAGSAPASISLSSRFIPLHDGQRYVLRFLRDSKAGSLDVRVQAGVYDATGTRTASNYVAYSSLDNTKIFDFEIGTNEIGSHSWNTAWTALDSNDKYLAFQITDLTYAQTYIYLFELDWNACTPFTSYEVHWLNRYGGFDSWIFNRRSKHNTQVETAKYKNDPFDIISPTPTTNQRYVKSNYTQLTETYELNTNNLQEWEYSGIKDLFASPEVYIRIGGDFYSATVEGKQQYQNYISTDGIYNVNVALKIDTNEQRQW